LQIKQCKIPVTLAIWQNERMGGKNMGLQKKIWPPVFQFCPTYQINFSCRTSTGWVVGWRGGGGGGGKFSNPHKSFETINISSIFHFYLTYFILLILFLLLLAQHTSINFITTFCFNYKPLKLALNGIFQIKHQRYLYWHASASLIQGPMCCFLSSERYTD
jgi:hypothetical protein